MQKIKKKSRGFEAASAVKPTELHGRLLSPLARSVINGGGDGDVLLVHVNKIVSELSIIKKQKKTY